MAAMTKGGAALLNVDGSATDAAEPKKVYSEMLDRLLEQPRPEIEQISLRSSLTGKVIFASLRDWR